MGRFISADNLVHTSTGILSHNMYIYCNNNSINLEDSSGQSPWIIIPIVIGIKIYRDKVANDAKKEIDKNQKIKNVPDRTIEINALLKTNSTDAKTATASKNRIQKLNLYANMVKTGAKYDLKIQDGWKNQLINYRGIIMTSEDFGNFHAGYIGRAIGLSSFEITSGAGIYQVISGTSRLGFCLTSRCDDTRDYYFVRTGIIQYDSEN